MLTLLISFVSGFLWGLYINKSSDLETDHKDLQVFAPEGLFPQFFIDDFLAQSHIKINLTEYPTENYAMGQLAQLAGVYDLVIIPSSISNFVLLKKLATELTEEELSLLKKVSVDFASLSFRQKPGPDNHFFVPLFWSTQGFLVSSEKSTTNPAFDLLEWINKSDIRWALKQNSNGVADLALRGQLIQERDLQTEKKEELFDSLKGFFSRVTWMRSGPTAQLIQPDSKLDLIQVNNVEAYEILNSIEQNTDASKEVKKWTFQIPEQKAALRVDMAYFPQKSSQQNRKLALELLKYISQSTVLKKLLTKTRLSSCLIHPNQEGLKPPYSALSLRDLPLSRIELSTSHSLSTSMQEQFKKWIHESKEKNKN